MVLSFKDPQFEKEMKVRVAQKAKTASQILRNDIMRYQFLLDDQVPINLTPNEFYAVASIVKNTSLFDEPSRIKRMELFVDDTIRSTTNSQTGEYSKVEQFDFDLPTLIDKLHGASTIQLVALVERCELVSEEQIDAARWKKRKPQ
jgi:hypothetical protein